MSRKKIKDISINDDEISNEIIDDDIETGMNELNKIEPKKNKKPTELKTLVRFVNGKIISVCPNIDTGSKQFEHFKELGFEEYKK